MKWLLVIHYVFWSHESNCALIVFLFRKFFDAVPLEIGALKQQPI